ncbi:hypothetical protein HW445_20365, partial [Streptomyces sp. UH6]|nr:hypothetical protein [Streptomyces sp. UH6]
DDDWTAAVTLVLALRARGAAEEARAVMDAHDLDDEDVDAENLDD